MTRFLPLLLLAGCAADEPVSIQTAELSTFETIDYPGAASTRVLGNNDLGHYVGLYVDTVAHAMRFDGHAMVPIDLGGARSRAYATNNLGDVVGSYSDAAGMLHGFRYHAGTVATIDHPSGAPTEVYGIDDFGRMIGVSYDADGNSHGFVLVLGHFTELAYGDFTIPLSINDLGDIVGEDITGDTVRGFHRSPLGRVTFSGADTYYISINNRRQILGAHLDGTSFVLARGAETAVDVPGVAQTLNDLGDIVGYFADDAGIHGFYGRHTLPITSDDTCRSASTKPLTKK
jgi:hypothetical protein